MKRTLLDTSDSSVLGGADKKRCCVSMTLQLFRAKPSPSSECATSVCTCTLRSALQQNAQQLSEAKTGNRGITSEISDLISKKKSPSRSYDPATLQRHSSAGNPSPVLHPRTSWTQTPPLQACLSEVDSIICPTLSFPSQLFSDLVGCD